MQHRLIVALSVRIERLLTRFKSISLVLRRSQGMAAASVVIGRIELKTKKNGDPLSIRAVTFGGNRFIAVEPIIRYVCSGSDKKIDAKNFVSTLKELIAKNQSIVKEKTPLIRSFG